MRLWNWEETVQKQREKQIVLWIAAVIFWVAAAALLYFIWKIPFGEAVRIKEGLSMAVLLWVVLNIGRYIRWWRGKQIRKMSKTESMVISVVLIVTFLVLGILQDTLLFMLQILPIGILSDWEDRIEGRGVDRISLAACGWILAALLLVVGTFAGLTLERTKTVGAVEHSIAAEGFTNVAYVSPMDAWSVRNTVEDVSFGEDIRWGEYCYLFSAEKGSEGYYIVVRPRGGDVLLAATETEAPKLAHWSVD